MCRLKITTDAGTKAFVQALCQLSCETQSLPSQREWAWTLKETCYLALWTAEGRATAQLPVGLRLGAGTSVPPSVVGALSSARRSVGRGGEPRWTQEGSAWDSFSTAGSGTPTKLRPWMAARDSRRVENPTKHSSRGQAPGISWGNPTTGRHKTGT